MTSDSDAVVILIRLGKVIELALAESALTVNQFRLLTFAEGGASDLREIAVRLAMKPSNASVLIDGLVARKLIERRRHPADGRRFELFLSRSGRRVLAQARDSCERGLRHIADTPGSPPDLIRSLRGWLTGLDAAATALQQDLSARDA